MKNYLVIVLLLLMSFGAGYQSNKTIVVPATPKMVSSDYFWSSMSAVEFIRERTRKGFILKSCTSSGNNNYWIVTMEKY